MKSRLRIVRFIGGREDAGGFSSGDEGDGGGSPAAQEEDEIPF